MNRIVSRASISILAGAFILVGSTCVHLSLDTPVLAKGIVKTGPNNSDDDKKDNERPQTRPSESPRPAPTPPPPPPAPKPDPQPIPPEQPRYEAPAPTPAPQPAEERQQPAPTPMPAPQPQSPPAPSIGKAGPVMPSNENDNQSSARPSTPAGAEPTLPRPNDTYTPPQTRENIGERGEHHNNVRPTPMTSSPERRPEGTPTVAGQIIKRQERVDTKYNWRKKHSYYPYDPYNYQYWPPDGIIVITSPYPPVPSSTYIAVDTLTETMEDMKTAWMTGDIHLMLPHIDEKRNVKLYVNGKFSHEVTPSQYYMLTEEAFERMKTLSFKAIWIKRGEGYARVKFRHQYREKNGAVKVVKSVYNFREIGDRWLIVRIDLEKKRASNR